MESTTNVMAAHNATVSWQVVFECLSEWGSFHQGSGGASGACLL